MPSIQCTLCEENQAVMMATSLETGDCISPCGPCLPGYALSLAAAMTDGMPPEVAEMYAEQFDAIAEHRGPSPKPTGRRPVKLPLKVESPEVPPSSSALDVERPDDGYGKSSISDRRAPNASRDMLKPEASISTPQHSLSAEA